MNNKLLIKSLIKEFLMSEMPHLELNDSAKIALKLGGNKDSILDLQNERLPISQKEKKSLLYAFNNEGIVGKLEGIGLVLFKRSDPQTSEIDNTQAGDKMHLPVDWLDNAVIV